MTSVREVRRRRRGHRRQRRHDDLRRRRDRHPPGPGARHARGAHRPPARAPVGAALQQQPGAPPHRHLAAARRARRPRLLELLPPGRRDRRGHGHLRPHPPAAAAHRHPLPRHPRRRGPRRPGHGDRPDGVRAPALHARVGGGLAPAAGDQHRAHRLRRGLPRLGLPRGRRALRPGRRHPPRPALDPHVARSSRGPAASRRRSATPGVRPSRGPSSTPRPSGSSTSTTCPTTACSPASRRATTSARPTARCAPTSRRSSPTTASPSATASGPGRS